MDARKALVALDEECVQIGTKFERQYDLELEKETQLLVKKLTDKYARRIRIEIIEAQIGAVSECPSMVFDDEFPGDFFILAAEKDPSLLPRIPREFVTAELCFSIIYLGRINGRPLIPHEYHYKNVKYIPKELYTEGGLIEHLSRPDVFHHIPVENLDNAICRAFIQYNPSLFRHFPMKFRPAFHVMAPENEERSRSHETCVPSCRDGKWRCTEIHPRRIPER
jgi:hypothetical protein